jgi:hypothetical protein
MDDEIKGCILRNIESIVQAVEVQRDNYDRMKLSYYREKLNDILRDLGGVIAKLNEL